MDMCKFFCNFVPEFKKYSTMILIADSGSTKCRWCLMTANGQNSEFLTDGINPLFQTSDAMRNSINNQLLPQIAPLLWAGTLTHVFFYGAGCIPEKIPFVEKALQMVFKKAEIRVESDMLAAARGLLGHKKGVACILGTGSNSCLYDGEKIVENVPSLGYILGDEGSAVALGKRLVSDVLTNQLGADIKEKFLTQYELNVASVIEHVYRLPFPNRWLAGLSKFCAENIDDERIGKLVYDNFQQFVARIVAQYFEKDGVENEETSHLPVGFVGSVAYYYRPVLEQVMSDYGFMVGQILRDPMEGLKEYHRADMVPTT